MTDLQQIKRRLRILAILSGAQRAALVPLDINALHTMAYFADALAPVWDLRILDAQSLKRRSGPFSPLVQGELDRMVGQGLIVPSEVRHSQDESGAWRLAASYRLNPILAAPVLSAAMELPEQAEEIRFVEEIVLAAAAIGPAQLQQVAATDAAYGDVEVAEGRMVDVEGTEDMPNLSARVAMRFAALVDSGVNLKPAELIHLYVRELDRRLRNAA